MNFFKPSRYNLERAKSVSKKIQKFNKFIRKPLIKHSRSFFLNLSYAEDSISTCDIQSNSEAFYRIEEEMPEDLSLSPKVKFFFIVHFILRYLF